MYCSNCGTGDQQVKTYCRRCGKWIGTAPPEDRLTVMIVFNALSALFGAAAAVALFVIYLGTASAKWLIYVAATFCLIISVYQTLSFFFALNLRTRIKQGQDKETPALGPPHKVDELSEADTSGMIGVRSVTENTTDLLERKPIR